MKRAMISTWAYALQLLANNERPQEISMLLTLVGLYFFGSQTLRKSSMPNIIFILADDLGWDDVSFHGSPQIPTPNMDALAADGIILNQHYAQALCTPSRAALMTGRYPIYTGMQHFVIQPGEPWGLPLEYRLMPEFFRDLGYKTHMVGKWHLGSFKKDFIPVRRGFDSFYGFYNADQDYYNKTLTEGEHTGYDFWLNEDIHIYPNNRYSTHHYTKRAVSLIRSHNPSQPLFLYLSYQAPHVGTGPSLLEAPEENVNKFLYIPEKNRTIYAGMVDALDQSIGTIMEALQEADLIGNTIVVFTSDNGALPWGVKSNRGYNWPLRGGKFTLWEGGLRTTAFIWSPLLEKSRRVSNQMMHIADWLPTLYSAAGGDPSTLGSIDGVNMWHALSREAASPRQEIVHNVDSKLNLSGIRVGKYKLIVGTFNDSLYDGRFRTVQGHDPRTDLDVLMKSSAASKVLGALYSSPSLQVPSGWRGQASIKCDTDAPEDGLTADDHVYLFDIEKDPCEMVNIAGKNKEIVAELRLKLAAHEQMQVEPRNVAEDPTILPEANGGVWKSME